MKREERIAKEIVSKAVLTASKITMTEASDLVVAGGDLVGSIYLKNVKPTIAEVDYQAVEREMQRYVQSLFQEMSKSAVSWSHHVWYSVKDNSFVTNISFKKWKDKDYTIEERIQDIEQARKRV